MMLVDIERGRTEGIALAKTLAELDRGYESSIESDGISDNRLN